MKKLMISAAIIAGGSLAAYLFKKYSASCNNTNDTSVPRSHHLTNSFARAKKHATHMA